ncbi:MAG TPA: DUF3878 family protein [Firmicutes bacterium]|nr:DUF3878 family protein [Bacillota bacterium]
MISVSDENQLFERLSAEFGEETGNVIRWILEQNICSSSFHTEGADAWIDIEIGTCCDCTLILKNVSGIPEGKFDCLFFQNNAFVKQGDEYILTGEAEEWEKDLLMPFSVRFTDAKVEAALYRADEQPFHEMPWEYLQLIAGAVLDKYHLSSKYLNDEEKELLPLMKEIVGLSVRELQADTLENRSFPLLKAYMARLRYQEILPLAECLENAGASSRKRKRIAEKLISQLNTLKYASLWRELFHVLTESQKKYPSRTACASSALLEEIRRNIQIHMERHGYSGAYPDYIKTGEVRGIHLAEAYNMDYFVGFEKRAVYHIHCTELYFDGQFEIQFVCGTELLRKYEAAGDIYSCLFDAKGRRLFHTVCYQSGNLYDGEVNRMGGLELCIRTAVKRAELIRLTKEERKAAAVSYVSCWGILFSKFVIEGGLFAGFMMIFFVLAAAATCFVFGEPQMILPVLSENGVWWKALLSIWILYGGAMSVIAILARRK